MKISCLPVSLFSNLQNGRLTIKDWAHLGKEIGLDAIDLSMILIKNHTPVYLEQIRDDIQSEGMAISMMTTYPDLTHPDPLQREREFEYLRHDVALTSYIGAQYLRILAGQAHPETKIDQGISWVIEYFKRISPVAKKFKVKLLYENHSKPAVWNYYDFSYRTEYFRKIVEGIRDTGIGINFDTANTIAYGDDPFTLLQEVVDLVETVHVADIAKKGEVEFVLIGTGIVPLKKIFHFLKKYGFDNWLCIEEASNMGIGGIRKAVNYVRSLWENGV